MVRDGVSLAAQRSGPWCGRVQRWSVTTSICASILYTSADGFLLSSPAAPAPRALPVLNTSIMQSSTLQSQALAMCVSFMLCARNYRLQTPFVLCLAARKRRKGWAAAVSSGGLSAKITHYSTTETSQHSALRLIRRCTKDQ